MRLFATTTQDMSRNNLPSTSLSSLSSPTLRVYFILSVFVSPLLTIETKSYGVVGERLNILSVVTGSSVRTEE